MRGEIMSDLSLDNIVTNNMNFKHLETTKDITISIKNENGFHQRPDATHTWTAKVSDGTNYVGDYAVKVDQTSLIVDSEDFTSLPVGSYQLEVWEEWIDPDGTKQRSIYPSPSQTIPFTIYANITDQAKKEIKSIGFQDVVDQAVMNVGMNYVFKVNTIEPDQTATVVQSAADGKNYVTFNIPQGPKGDQGNVGPAPTLTIGTVTKLNPDQTPTVNLSGGNGSYTLDMGIPQGATGNTGTVDNTWLISAPAFQNLQTQVNNSAVGTNLLLGTSKTLTTVTNASDWNFGTSVYKSHMTIVNSDTPYTARAWISPASHAMAIQVAWKDSSGNMHYNSGNFISAGTSGYSTWKGIITAGSIINYVTIVFGTQQSTASSVSYGEVKLERGSQATDWSPNPTEILTQSDYAKIKAAIVALGGSLS